MGMYMRACFRFTLFSFQVVWVFVGLSGPPAQGEHLDLPTRLVLSRPVPFLARPYTFLNFQSIGMATGHQSGMTVDRW